jgi:hypothetical protein
MILGRINLDADQRALCARIQDCVDQAIAADPSLAGHAETVMLDLSEALASGPSDFDDVPWKRFFKNVLMITRRLDATPTTPRQRLAIVHLVHLIDENRDLVD